MQIERNRPLQHTYDLESFQQAVNSSFVPLQVTAPNNQEFGGSLSAAGADGVMFTEVSATSSFVERTERTISQGGSGYYKVSLLLSGSSILIQDGREVVMQPGDLSFYDTSRPYSLLFDDEFRNLIMMFPKDRLEFPTLLTDSLTAVSLGEQHQLARAISPFIAQASPHLLRLPVSARTKLAHTSLELINTVLSAILDIDAQPHDPHEVMLKKITAYITQNLGSHDLSPSSIAAAHYISTRHLHALFSQTETTVSAWIKERRLERCRTDLLNPAHTHIGIAAIATRWGFTDAAHFSRVFRAAYGISPSEFRRSH